jgi:diguanylate cyclase (GGDEF)-like protein
MPFTRPPTSVSGINQSRVPLSRRFTSRYVLALFLVVTLGLVTYLTSSNSLDAIDAKTSQLQAATGQEARIYRINSLAHDLDVEDGLFIGNPPTGRKERVEELASKLKQESTSLQQIEGGLLHGDASLHLPAVAVSSRLNDIYTGQPQLDQKIQDTGAAADQVVRYKDPTIPNIPLRQQEIQRLDQLRDDTVTYLEASIQVYSDEVAAIINQQRNVEIFALLASVLLVSGIGLFLFRPMARKIASETTQLEEAEKIHRENNERQTFRASLSQALEVTDSEDEVLAAVGRAVLEMIPDNKAELLLMDSSQAHLRNAQVNPNLGGAGCPVDSPRGCAAIRRGQTQVYESSRMLNVCPKLPEHAGGPCSAVCVPVMFSGTAIGVLHAVGADNNPPSHTQIERMTVLASETGNHLGTLRVTHMTELQASTDGLTGLLNRRSVESKARSVMLEGTSFSVAIADLDHFKDLNDTYGHEAGDRALRLFAKVMKDNLRPDDIPARYGGEEFVVLLPDTTIHEALAAIERLQLSLAQEIDRVSSVPFTASWGLTDNSSGPTFDQMMSVADAALYSAKRAGRNCIMVDGEAAAGDTGPSEPWNDPPTPATPKRGSVADTDSTARSAAASTSTSGASSSSSSSSSSPASERRVGVEGEPIRPRSARPVRPHPTPPV